MFTAHLFTTTDLLALTLTLLERQAEQLKEDEKGSPYNEALDEELTTASDQFFNCITAALDAHNSEVLEDAIETFYAVGNIEAGAFLNSAVQSLACQGYDDEGNLLEAVLIPLVMAREDSNESLTAEACRELARIYAAHHPNVNFKKVTVRPRLGSPAEIFSLRFHEVQDLYETSSANFKNLATEGLHVFNDPLWTPTLRFLIIQTVTAAPDGHDDELEDDFKQLTSPPGLPEDTGPPAALAYRPLIEEMATALAVTYGAPLVSGAPKDLFGVRHSGTMLYAHKVARVSVGRQLALAVVSPSSVAVTAHTAGTPGPDALVHQLRISFLAGVNLLAGHIIECGPSLSEEDGLQLVSRLCEEFGIQAFDMAKDTLGILDTGLPPYFFATDSWNQLPHEELRLTQETFD